MEIWEALIMKPHVFCASILSLLHACTYIGCAGLQWILYGIERGIGVECSTNLALAAALFSTFAAVIKCGHQTFFSKVPCWAIFTIEEDLRSNDKSNDPWPWDDDKRDKDFACGVILLISIVPYVLCKMIAIILTICLIATTNSGFCSETVGPVSLIIALILLETGSVYLEFCTAEGLFFCNKLKKCESEQIDCSWNTCVYKIMHLLCTPFHWACGWSILHIYIYTTCAILQWILYANEKDTGAGCMSNLVLAAAIFTSLATFLKYGHQTCRIYSEYYDYLYPDEEKSFKYVCAAMSCCSAMPFVLCKATSTILTIILVAVHNTDPCGSETIGPPPILGALAILEPVSVLLEFLISECPYAIKHFGEDDKT